VKPGNIHHLQEVEPLHGGVPKGRYVVVVTRSEDIAMDLPLFVVACTASAKPEQIASGQAVPLPWSRQGTAGTGFRRPTWAVPAWLLRVRPSQLGRRVGHVPSNRLQQIIAKLPPDPELPSE
jgi:hypothetical protein